MRREFPAVARSVSAARSFVRAVAAPKQPAVALDVVALLTSELVTNAVVFGEADRVAVAIDDSPRGVAEIRVEVTDSNPSPPALRDPQDDEDHGRGLLLVHQLAADWGSYPVPGVGKVVWFEL